MAILTRLRSFPNPFRSSRRSHKGDYHTLNDRTHPAVGTGDDNCDKNEVSRKKCDEGKKKEKEKGTNVEMARSRLWNELSKLDDEIQLNYFSYGPIDPLNPFKLQGMIIGPSGTPFQGGLFFLSIHVPKNYPFKPPKIKFLTKVFHPNVTSDGKIEIDILSSEWSPALTIEKLLISICSFLPDPNHVHDSCNPICDLFWNQRHVYDNIAREWTLKYAMI